MDEDTIFALSSGALPSGVAIIRLSGPRVEAVVTSLCGSPPAPRRAALRILRHPVTGLVLDEALVLFFAAPNSFTGEDVAELQCHGGRATVAAILDCLSEQHGCRIAEAGEFSRRAFLNGRMDLTELEGLSDLVAAETEQQRRLALEQSGGSLRSLYEDWRTEIVHLRALLEADFDFADEDDVPGSVAEEVVPRLKLVMTEIARHVAGLRQGEIVRDGFKVVLTGAPNAGKSTIFNGLLQREAAIVTDVPGTTRDVLEARLDIDGFLVRVFDTAGIRESTDTVERLGIERARQTVDEADLVIHLQAADSTGETEPTPPDATTELVFTHGDGTNPEPNLKAIDARSAAGVQHVMALISSHLASISIAEQALPTRLRYREGLETCLQALEKAANPRALDEIRAEHLRVASDAIGRLTGRVDVEDLLDVIFSQFCIGK